MAPLAAVPLWSLHDAKNRLSELIHRAEVEGPQTITRHGTPVVVVSTVVPNGTESGMSAWELLRDDFVSSIGDVPEPPRRVADAPAEVPLPW